ncbi:MAG TPA: hypothetical protein VGD49_03375 [Longimicrobiales bacterium]
MKTPAPNQFLIAVLFAIAFEARAEAQTYSGPRLGDWVLIETSNAARTQGRLIRVDGDSVVLAAGQNAGHHVAFARSAVSNVWVSVGQRRQTMRGLTLGLVAGGTVGALVGAITYTPCHSDEFLGCLLAPENAGQAALLGGTVGGFFGLLIGTGAGFATKRHVWEVAGVPTTVGVAPARDGAVSLSLRLAL